MSNVLVTTPEEQQVIEQLLAKQLPNYRQAYSDRTAWLMACISELAYIRFNPITPNNTQQYLLKNISKLLGTESLKSLEKLVDLVGYDPEQETAKLKENADFINLKLVKTFDKNGSQAILLENEQYIVLGFRGTEASSIKDIKADLNAVCKQCDSGGKIHSGFNQAFAELHLEIANFLEHYPNKPLFITGHSLGGALATVASKKLNHKAGIAACYTFGSPRVGDAFWCSNCKTPIYRLVNAADPVTMLPPSDELITLLAWVLKFTPIFGERIKNLLLNQFNGYLHSGDMRYLTNCQPGAYDNVQLLTSVSFWFRLKALFIKKMSIMKIPKDHSISVYRAKLKVIAIRRN